jgi:hypothetical protein
MVTQRPSHDRHGEFEVFASRLDPRTVVTHKLRATTESHFLLVDLA